MIRMVATFRRHPDLTREQFIEYWRSTHADLIRNGSAANYVSRYEQMATLPNADGDPEPAYDGVVIQDFESREAFDAHMQEPDAPAMMEDMAKFIDAASVQFVLTEAPYVVI